MISEAEGWFANLADEQRETAIALRRLVLASDARMREEFKWNQPCYSINSMICYIQKARTHLSIGFREGTRLSDPVGLLQGAGTQMRHVRLRNGEAVDPAIIAAFLAEAIAFDAEKK